MTDTIESLRARVGELEEATDIAIEINNSLTSELDAIKAGQGEPVAWLFCMGEKEEQEALLPHEVDPEAFEENPHYYTQLCPCTQAPTKGQGEPVATVAGSGVKWIQPQAGELKDRQPLYTQAPAIPEGWQLARTDDIQFCIDSIRDWGAYASAYAMGKWDLAGDIQRAKAMLDAPKP